MWSQKSVTLSARSRGFHLITKEIIAAIPEITSLKVGMMHAFLQHTSASLSINENADPDVRRDLEMAMNNVAPSSWPYVHTIEGSDDMPAHVKSSLIGCSVSIPIRDGKLSLGTWQGIYFGEHRDHGGPRTVIVTIQGE
jgi:secondary thiamine-phosphate synthase enzyme